MADCDCLAACPFFNDQMAGMDSMADLLKKRDCKGDFDACARYRVFKAKGREQVPADLFPNQADRADALVV